MTLSSGNNEILRKKIDEYVKSIEVSGGGVDYDEEETDRLLILEAVNDWSGMALSRGGNVTFSYECDDPCCATASEVKYLVKRMREYPVILYPVSGFTLSDQCNLQFDFCESTFRMTPHASGSRSDGIVIAKARHLWDVDQAMQLWVFCAAEDCMAYLYHQLEEHGLGLEDAERSAIRQIVTSSLQDHFSIGQIWNAMWRSVKDAAALSTRQYYNNEKASKTIPKKIDNVLTNAISDPGFAAFGRIAAIPLGAVLTLFRKRFGIDDEVSGANVRTILASNAGVAPRKKEFDEGRKRVQGTIFFLRQFTELDQIILSCFDDLRLEAKEPEWDEERLIGRISYSLADLYAFNGTAFGKELFGLMQVPPPSAEDLVRHAAIAKKYKEETGKWVDLSGWNGALSEALVEGGLDMEGAREIARIILYPSSLEDITHVARHIPLPKGIWAARIDYAHICDTHFEKFDQLSVGDFTFSIPEEQLGPDGCDRDIVVSVANENLDRLAELVGLAILNSVWCKDAEKKRRLLTYIADKLLEKAHRDDSRSDNSAITS